MSIVMDDDPAYSRVLGPLVEHLNLKGWDGLQWNLVFDPIGNGTYIIGLRKEYAILKVFEVRHPDRHPDLPVEEHSRWWAFHALSLWTAIVAKSLGLSNTPPEWMILTIFPGRLERIPRHWIDTARENPSITWGEWKLACELAAKSVIPLDRYSISTGVRLIRNRGAEAMRGEIALKERSRPSPLSPDPARQGKGPATNFERVFPEPEAVGGSRRKKPGRPKGCKNYRGAIKTIPREWQVPFERMTENLAPSTVRTYYSALRRIYRESETPVVSACTEVVDRVQSPTLTGIWERFVPFLYAHLQSKPGLETQEPINLSRGIVLSSPRSPALERMERQYNDKY